jgi:hypothetical protein
MIAIPLMLWLIGYMVILGVLCEEHARTPFGGAELASIAVLSLILWPMVLGMLLYHGAFTK